VLEQIGQPIRLTLVSNSTPAARPRNPFDTAQKPSRSLFDRITEPATRSRSRSPDRNPSIRHSDVSKPPPGHIDRYIPGQRTRSPLPTRRGGGSAGGRRPGARRDERERGSGRLGKDGRPRKTQEELDAEMEDYFGGNGEETGHAVTGMGNGAGTGAVDGDVDMIE
jgi:THO complex subunit 4